MVVACLTTSWVVAQAVPSPSIPALLKTQREVTIEALKAAISRGDDGIGPLPTDYLPDDEDMKEDDAMLRALWQRLNTGPISQESVFNVLQETQRQADRERSYAASTSRLVERGEPSPTPVSSLRWVPLGPQSALSEWNGSYYDGLDSGRVASIRVDPTNPATVYIGAIGGGIWKTPDITLVAPVWTPITDSLGTIFIGSFDIDPTNSSIIHAGLGDYWEGNTGGVMVTTTDGGATWSTPKPLIATLPSGTQFKAVNVRTVKIDPNNRNHILVASDVGLFRSTDAGETYAQVDLPNTALYGTTLEGGFSIVYTGLTNGQSTFLVSGNYACPGTFPPSFNQPSTGFFVTTCAGLAPNNGNLGDVWKSIDGGATWTSVRVAGALPVPANGDIGRLNLAVAEGATPDTSVVYALAANQTGAQTVAVLKSFNGGDTWTFVAQGRSTLPTNPTPGATGQDCTNMDIGHGQSQYDLAIAVDPGNPDNVLIGGNLCGARTNNGGTTWQIASNWLAFGGAEGPLPYVHADWHTGLITRVNGQPITLAGTDGGIFVSYDLFAAQRGADVNWFDANVGLDTHLPYSVGSGDPVFGTAQIVLTGLQDNGTRFRVSQTEAYLSSFPQAWNQIQGGDGFGAAVSNDAAGMNVTTWGVANGGRRYCRGALECSRATRVENGAEVRSWYPANPPLPAGDANGGFSVRYVPLYDAAGSVITNSNFNLWRMTTVPGNVAVITRLATSPPPPGVGGYTGCGSTAVRSIRAAGPQSSPFTYDINGAPSRVHGLPLAGGCYAVVVDPGRPDGVVTVVSANTIPQFGNEQVQNTAGITFPRDPTNLGGTDITKTYVVSSIGDFFVSVPPVTPPRPITADIGRIFMTNDGGTTWTPLHGNGTGFDLPNVRIYVVKFDPSDPTDQTLYAGTDVGLFRTTDLGKTWVRYGNNLPAVRVQDLFVSLNGSLIRVAMYGRGIWELYPRSDGAGGLVGAGDFDRNGVVDYRDLANLTNRMTTSPPPATPTPTVEFPFYDSEMNLTEEGAATTINEDDLNAVLTKFGGAP